MIYPRDAQSLGHLEAALEGSCDTFIALELLRTLAGEEPELEACVSHAIRSVGRTIAELRAALHVGELVHAFVLNAPASTGDPSESAPGNTQSQSRPRRTA